MNTLNIPYTIKPVKSHTKIKEDLLTEIQNSEGKILSQTDNYYSDNISKYDWHLNMDFNRPWVKFFEPYLKNELLETIEHFGFSDYYLKVIWYQQYSKGGTHGWHTHSDNYTGVYYLEMSEESPKTQIVNPTNHNEIIDLNVKEGDIVLFPSFVIHRAPINSSVKRKTIISFDINFADIKKDLLSELRKK